MFSLILPVCRGARDGVAVRALASYQWSGSKSVESVVSSRPCSEGFSPGSLSGFPPRGTPRKFGWECAARRWETLTLFQTKMGEIFPILFQT